MTDVRYPAVAGTFYPAEQSKLRAVIAELLAHPCGIDAGQVPKAIIAPHAGYIYSGPIAASAYASILPARGTIERVVLLGPAHRFGFRGIAAPGADSFATPLGEVPVDREALASIRDLPQVRVLDHAHAGEHSLEVHLPFLQEALGSFTIVPLVVGDAGPEEVAAVLERLWGGPETLVVVSSDLSHYLAHDAARVRDRATSRAIEDLRLEDIAEDDACGCHPLRGLLLVARRKGLSVRTIDLRSSGDTAGSRDQVVGYGAFVVG